MDFFKNTKNLTDIHAVQIKIPDEVPDEMPKYTADFMDMLRSGQSPMTDESFEEQMLGHSKEYRLKEAYNMAGMYAFVSWRWVEPFAEWIGNRKVLEVMAGRGWLTYALRQKGIDIAATDNFSWKAREWVETLTQVDEADAIESIDIFKEEMDILIIAWPYMDNTAYQVMKRLNEVRPDVPIVYIGEMGGCTADDDFWGSFEIIHDEKFEKAASLYQSWFGIHDNLYLGKMRSDRNES
ncbi:hypothetical protein [Cytobacillus oceanisediminis]|uniref:hypothetical protein n=1 Tax=Cytobacillus oceanisediminis TaxID=665099 RepID=UPI001FB41B48|nr:hypothetical protein [Cytobacillus oceanisediminis]UOE58048.1 hypothetical protein IRB79_27680 [Cytobacillus oceanisediminis]